MDHIDIGQVTGLMETDSRPRVSIYMETHRTGREIRQGPIRFKNLLREASKHMQEKGLSLESADRLLAPASMLLTSEEFWSNQSDGLAAFIAEDGFQTYRLPLAFREQVHIRDHYFIKPLLPIVSDNRKFNILLLDQHNVAFFEATRYTIEQAQLKDATTDIKELLQYNVVEKQVQVHAGAPGFPGGGGIFHGQGTYPDAKVHKKDIAQFIAGIEKAVYRAMAAGNRPLVLGGIEYLRAMYRQSNSYQNLMPEGFSTPPVFHTFELLPQAWECAKPYLEQEMTARLDSWSDFSATDRTGKNIGEIFHAAKEGKVDILFYDPDAMELGSIHPETGEIVSHDPPQPDDEDLIDLAVMETLKHGGTVYAVNRASLPLTAGAGCIYRY